VADQAETPKILDDLSKKNTANSKSPSARQKQTARRRFLIVILLLSPLILAIAFVGYQQWLLDSQLVSLAAENQQLSNTITNQNVQLQQIRETLSQVSSGATMDDAAVQEIVQASGQQFREEISRLNQLVSELQSQQSAAQSTDNSAFAVAEVGYLLRVANQKIQLESDVAGAINLLASADSILSATGDSSNFSVRESIARELTALRNVTNVDTDGIYLRIENMSQRVNDLELAGSLRQNFQNRDGQTQAIQIGTTSAGIIDSSLRFLSTVFVWRKWDEMPDAIQSPQQVLNIKQNLRLIFEQTQLALLQRDESLFMDSLQKSQSWLQRYAVTESGDGQAMLGEVAGLMALNISPELPDISNSLSLFNRLSNNDL
jgi:uroporphyrin-III C-methyltransferase